MFCGLLIVNHEKMHEGTNCKRNSMNPIKISAPMKRFNIGGNPVEYMEKYVAFETVITLMAMDESALHLPQREQENIDVQIDF